MDVLLPRLKAYPFLKGFSQEHLHILAGCATLETFEVGKNIFYEGDEANHFYLITKGRVSLTSDTPQGKAIIVQHLEEGDMLGWSWLIPPHYWRFGARPVYPTEAIVLDGKFLRQQCQADPAFGYALLERMTQIISQRLEITRIKLLEPQNTERF